jgi:class 3 adenylate cyclase
MIGAALPVQGNAKFGVVLWTFLLFAAVASTDDVYPPGVLGIMLLHLALAAVLAVVVSYFLERFRRHQYLLRVELSQEKARSEALLLNTLPAKIAARLKTLPAGSVIVDQFAEVSVVFADIVGFTPLAATRTPEETVGILNDLFSRFDAAAAMTGVEKIKTIGDAYMAVAGLPEPTPDNAERAVQMALDIREAVHRYRLITGLDIAVRIGVHTGPVAAGVIGTKKYLYDLWGDTVNVAARLESQGISGQIQISADTLKKLGDRYEVEARGMVPLKGKGDVEVFVLKGPKVHASDAAA